MSEILQVIQPFWKPTKQLPDPELLMFYKGLENRDIWLDQEIDYDSCSILIKYIMHCNRNDIYAECKDPIHLHIFSNGGALNVMFMLYDIIKNSKVPIYTYNEGACHSAAFIVFLSGHKRYMRPHALFVAHEGSSMIGGSYRETKSAMAQYDKEVELMCNTIASETKLDIETIKLHFDVGQDWYINYDEAKEFEIIKE